MANTNAPFGLKPVRYWRGGAYSGQIHSYYVPSTDGNAMYVGDPLVLVGTGNVAAFMDYPVGTLQTVTLATAGASNLICGSLMGVLPLNRESTTYRAASVEAIVFVADELDLVFEVQDNGGGTLGATTVGLNAMFISGVGSTVTGQSAYALDGGTSTAPAATATYQLKILSAANRAGNDCTSNYAIWNVMINQHSFMKNVAGV